MVSIRLIRKKETHPVSICGGNLDDVRALVLVLADGGVVCARGEHGFVDVAFDVDGHGGHSFLGGVALV